MPEVPIAAEPRTEFGKGFARRIRVAGKVPAVLYGHGTDTRHLTLPGHALMMALKTQNALIRVEGLPGGNELALPKAVQRNPIRGDIEHVNLIMVRRGEKVTVEVAVRVTGEVFPGGLLDQQLVQVQVDAEATNIPQGLEVNVEGMEIGAAVHAGDLDLPAGVVLAADPEGARPARDRRADGRADGGRSRASGGRGGCRSAARGAAARRRGSRRIRWRRRAVRLIRLGRRASREDSGMADERWLIIGLGNPGPEYAGNRHNAGRMVAELLARRMGSSFRRHRSRADIAEGTLAGVPVTVGIARSYMNLSGGPVAALSDFYKIPPSRIVVIHDELDVPFGEIRLKFGGGTGGHNGLRSVSAALGTRDFFRVRFGIGRPPGRMDPARFVLRDFTAAERKELPLLIERAADAAEALLRQGLGPAQNTFHAPA